METSKQKAIKEAYVNLIGEEKYYIIQYDINFDKGWCKNTGFNFLLDTLIFDRWGIDNEFSRPKNLQGIENNNGWIKIESEDDLPEEEGTQHFALVDGIVFFMNYNENAIDFWKEVTHYQPITKPKPPIY